MQMKRVYLRCVKAKKELIARICINLIVCVFLVKWYFAMPLFLQYSEGWASEQIANIIFMASAISLGMNWYFTRNLVSYKIENVFYGLLITFIFSIVFIAVNLYLHHWVAFCVILMAIFYNLLQSTINHLIHRDILTLEINLFFLVVGSVISRC